MTDVLTTFLKFPLPWVAVTLLVTRFWPRSGPLGADTILVRTHMQCTACSPSPARSQPLSSAHSRPRSYSLAAALAIPRLLLA